MTNVSSQRVFRTLSYALAKLGVRRRNLTSVSWGKLLLSFRLCRDILAFYNCYCSLVEDVLPACLILGHGRICASCFAHHVLRISETRVVLCQN